MNNTKLAEASQDARIERLRCFMEAHDIRWQDIGEQLNISPQRACGLLRRQISIPAHFHEKLLNLGFPQNTIPEARPKQHIPRFPGLQKHQQPATYQTAG